MILPPHSRNLNSLKHMTVCSTGSRGVRFSYFQEESGEILAWLSLD